MLPIVLSGHVLFLSSITLILIAYFFQQDKWMKTDGFLYNFINTCASGLLVYLAFRPFQLEFFTIAVLWATISVIRLYKSFR